MKLVRPILLRLAYSVLSLLFIAAVTFLATDMAPGDPARVIAGEKATEQAYRTIRAEMGLDQPLPRRFAQYMTNLAQGDMGRSYFGARTPVVEKIKQNLPMTLTVASLAIGLAALVGISLGVFAGVRPGGWVDRVILGGSTLGVTIPNFVLAPVLVLILSVQMGLLPTSWSVNRTASDFYYLVLPVTILSLRPMATLTRLTRAQMIDTMQQEFIRLAIAKGVPRTRLILRHGLRNAIMPVITAMGTSFGFLLTGSFIVETAFTMPGIGREAIEAIQKRDIPMIQGTTLVAGALFVFVNLVVDILQPILDPRIREAQV